MSMNRVASGGDIAKQERFGISSPNFCCRDSEKSRRSAQGFFEPYRRSMTQISKRPAAIDVEARQGQAASRSLRFASRTLTRLHVDGRFPPRLFAARTGRMAGFEQQNVLVANKPRRPIAVTRRAGAQRRTRHSASQVDVRLARTLAALWRVDGDRAAWRHSAGS